MASFSPKITSCYSADFLHKVDLSNEEKKDAPIALFLIAKDILESPVMTAPFLSFIQTVASCNYVCIELIENSKEIKEIIDNKRKLLGRSIHLLVIDAHGKDIGIHLGDKQFYKIEDVTKDQFQGLSQDANILLHSCNTGSNLYHMKNIAQEIADISQRNVLAPTRPITPYRNWYYFCETHQRVEFQSLDLCYKPYIFEFQCQKEPQLVDCKTDDELLDYFKNYEYAERKEEIDSLLLEQTNTLIESKDDRLLDTYCRDKFKFLTFITELTPAPSLEFKVGKKLLEHKKYERAYVYIHASEKQNNIDAILLMGDKYCSEGKLLEAKDMYQKAEMFGSALAKEKLAAIEDKLRK